MNKVLVVSKSLLSIVVLTGILAMPSLSMQQDNYSFELHRALFAKYPTKHQKNIIHGHRAMESVTLDKNPIPTEPEPLKKRGEEVAIEVKDLRSQIESLGDKAKNELEAQDKRFKDDWYVRRSIAVGYAKKLNAPSLAEDVARDNAGWECAIKNYQERMGSEYMPTAFIDHPHVVVVIPYYDILLRVIDVQINQQRRLSLKILLSNLKNQ